MFQKDDIITYGTPGVCRVTGIIERTFAGATHQYYELQPVYDAKSTLFVPVENRDLVGKMHRLLSAEAIHELLQSIAETETCWIENEPQRKQWYKEALENGDRKALLCAVKTLYEHQQSCKKEGKKMHLCDERFFKDAERVLYDEFAFVLHIDRKEILNYILASVEG